jgi:pimeloyl-ACP methyl ester carboxylesterase
MSPSALDVLGDDVIFPNTIEGLPAKLSDFAGLQIHHFMTSDGVKLAYWETGEGEPLIILPGWSGSGADYINVMYLLQNTYHIYVLDPRNQGLSDRVNYGIRIARMAADLKEFSEHIGLEKAYFCGHSMGASVIWSYIDLFGTTRIRKAVFIDEPISIYTHADWSEQERLEAGGMTTSAERMIAAFAGVPTNAMIVDLRVLERAMAMDSPSYQNSRAFAQAVIKPDMNSIGLVLFDHIMNDWRDVIRAKMDIPTAIFTGEYSSNLPSQQWMRSVISGAELYVYTKEEQGDHFLPFKNPVKFTQDLTAFLARY